MQGDFYKTPCARCFLRKHISQACFNYCFGCTGSLLLQGLPSSLGPQASRCGGFSHGARALGVRASVLATHGLGCSVAGSIFLDQGLNPCPLQWQADSQLLDHQESPSYLFIHVCSLCVCIHLHTWIEEQEVGKSEVFPFLNSSLLFPRSGYWGNDLNICSHESVCVCLLRTVCMCGLFVISNRFYFLLWLRVKNIL